MAGSYKMRGRRARRQAVRRRGVAGGNRRGTDYAPCDPAAEYGDAGMSVDLLTLKVAKRPRRLRLSGRVLFLVDDAELMRRQLAGEDLALSPELRARLRDQISTDEITPAYICYYFDETLGDFPYLGFRASGEFPVTRGSVRRGGFVCSVSGKRRGKGSSREQSPYAELMAGIQIVIAENLERIYNENCQNLGVLTSTDFDLIGRIRAGEEIELTEFTAGVDPITREIIEYGGLFEYNVARMQGNVRVPPLVEEGEVHGGIEPDLSDPVEVRALRGAGERDPGAETSRLENAAAQTAATSRPTDPVHTAPAAGAERRGTRPMTIGE